MAEHDYEEKFEKFHDLRPLRSAPPLMRAAGCGFGLYGSRGFDADTGSYVKTYCFSLLFLPVLALGAYRVADAPDGGWYFLGRVRLSPLARLWNSCLIALLAGGLGLLLWKNYTESANYLAGQKLAEADALAAAGQRGKAAELYREVAAGNTEHAGRAEAKLKETVDGTVADGPLADAAAACKAAVALKRPPAVAGLFDRAMQRAKADEAADPRGALDLLDAVAPLAPDAKAVTPTRQRLLEKVVAREPDNPEPASELAVIYEGQKRQAECEALLLPHKDRLGTREGARILGHILVSKGDFEPAHNLLQPYVEERLQKLHRAEERLKTAYTRADQQITEEIKRGVAVGFPYDAVKAAGEEQQGVMVNEYFASRLKGDPEIKAAREELLREAPVVPVALDLGIVLLRRAQQTADPKAREAELEKAEKTFLAVQGQAGETVAYRLFLGQVYYWMGKPQQGRKLFDELLEAEQRDPQMMAQVAMTLREVGSHSEARALVEEAYRKEQDEKKKHRIAGQRALLFTDLDDEITWLGRANPADPHIQASLAAARGQKAYEDGNDAEAAKQLRQAVALYDKMTEDAGALNNSGIACFSLFCVTGEREALEQAISRVERAVALRPRDTILLTNASHKVLDGALRDVVGPAIDLKALKAQGPAGLLPFLYADRAGRDRLAERARQHPGVAKARALLERLVVLAPRGESGWAMLAALYGITRDRAALVGLARRLEGAELDQADTVRKTLEAYQGKDRAKRVKELNATRQREEALVKSLRQGQRGAGVTFAAAATELAATLRGLGEEGGSAGDPDRVVALAEEAHQVAPSSATHTALRDALLYRASRTLEKQEPAYKQMATRARRSLGTSYLVAAALSREGKAREAALKNADVKRALELMREDLARFPDEAGPRTWVMLRAAHPAEAAKVAAALAKDEAHQATLAVGRKLSPVSATTALQTYWGAQMAGKEAEGRAALKAVAARGVPLPFDP
jgi:hypothetical protein